MITDYDRYQIIDATVRDWMQADPRTEKKLWPLAEVYVDAFNEAYQAAFDDDYRERVAEFDAENPGMHPDERDAALTELADDAKSYANDVATEAAKEALDEAEKELAA